MFYILHLEEQQSQTKRSLTLLWSRHIKVAITGIYFSNLRSSRLLNPFCCKFTHYYTTAFSQSEAINIIQHVPPGIILFDIVPQWLTSNHTSIQTEKVATVGESLTNVSINKATDEIDAESGCENDTPVIEKQLIVPAKRIQALEDQCTTQQNKMNKLESRLDRTTVLCTSLFCINIAISGVMLLKFISKQWPG